MNGVLLSLERNGSRGKVDLGNESTPTHYS